MFKELQQISTTLSIDYNLTLSLVLACFIGLVINTTFNDWFKEWREHLCQYCAMFWVCVGTFLIVTFANMAIVVEPFSLFALSNVALFYFKANS